MNSFYCEKCGRHIIRGGRGHYTFCDRHTESGKGIPDKGPLEESYEEQKRQFKKILLIVVGVMIIEVILAMIFKSVW